MNMPVDKKQLEFPLIALAGAALLGLMFVAVLWS